MYDLLILFGPRPETIVPLAITEYVTRKEKNVNPQSLKNPYSPRHPSEDHTMTRIACTAAIASGLLSLLSPVVAAQGILVYHVILEQPAPALPQVAGVDDGSGFIFDTFTDDNGDGMIELPPVPIPSRLALGVTHSVEGVRGCDIWDLMGGEVTDRSIDVPLFLASQPGAAMGVDFGDLAPPPVAFTPGQRSTASDGILPEWPDIRLVDESNVPDLQTFAQVVDTLPGFTGEVLVSNTTVHFTLVPEPSTLLISLIACSLLLTDRRRVPLDN